MINLDGVFSSTSDQDFRVICLRLMYRRTAFYMQVCYHLHLDYQKIPTGFAGTYADLQLRRSCNKS
jgi:hypothetical protein